MNVLIAGATGVIGRQLVPMLIDAGDDVTVLARADRSEAPPGVRSVHAGAFDREAVSAAVRHVDPEAIVDLRTAIPRQLDPRRFEEQMALTNRLRSRGDLDPDARVRPPDSVHLAGTRLRLPAQRRDTRQGERCPVDRRPAAVSAIGACAEELERLTAEVGGLTLRFGHLYGPGTSFAHDGAFIQQLMSRRAPIVGHGDSVFSFTHTADAASAVVVALPPSCPRRAQRRRRPSDARARVAARARSSRRRTAATSGAGRPRPARGWVVGCRLHEPAPGRRQPAGPSGPRLEAPFLELARRIHERPVGDAPARDGVGLMDG